MPKNVSKREHVLDLLKKAKGKGVTVKELIRRCGERAPARIFDLRKDGFHITTEPSRGPDCRYILGTKSTKVARKKNAKG